MFSRSAEHPVEVLPPRGTAGLPGPGRRAGRRAVTLPPSVFGDHVTTGKLVLRFTVTGLVTLVVVAVLTALASIGLGTREAIDNAITSVTLAGSAVVESRLTDDLLRADPALTAALDLAVRRELIRDSLVRVKIWSADGQILYSDQTELIGERFPMREDQREALETGRPAADLSDLSHPENRFESRAVELLEVYLLMHTPNGTPVLFESYFRYEGVTEAGRRIWVRFVPYTLGSLVLLELLQVPIAVALARRLRRSQRQREDLLLRSMEAVDDERRRIAGDLHDGVVQELAGVAFSLGAAGRGPGGGVDPARVRVAADQVRQSVRSLRSLLVEIYPPNLYEEGLEPALTDLLARVAARGLRTALEVDVALGRLGVDETELLYRVAQEGLRNVVQHADATAVEIRVLREDGTLVMTVHDDGPGIDPTALPRETGHLGLRALAGLAGTVGGSLMLASGPEEGTTLRLEVPSR